MPACAVNRVVTIVDGVVIRVIPSERGGDVFTEYEVDFDNGKVVGISYATQLRPRDRPADRLKKYPKTFLDRKGIRTGL